MKPAESAILSSFHLSRQEVICDYTIACQSRHMSLVGRREVLSGKAKFGIFGDGKEVVQLAMARAFEAGDFRSGYYRDQTLILALQGPEMVAEYFAQLYAHTDELHDPASGGRAMNAHFATRSLEANGSWRDITACFNSSADVSPTASQMPRLVGLGYASRLYREQESLKSLTQFSHHGNEIAWGTIGNAATAEGMFWESINAIGVLQAPVIVVIYDDGYGISVPNEEQLTKPNLSELLAGFQRQPGSPRGFELHTLPGWDYLTLVTAFQQAAQITRQEHTPAIFHITELTQPQGHSTSGSHERYKPPQRLAWEKEHDALKLFGEWIITQELAGADELKEIDQHARRFVEQARQQAWESYLDPILAERSVLLELIQQAAAAEPAALELQEIHSHLQELPLPLRRDLDSATQAALLALKNAPADKRQPLMAWRKELELAQLTRYGSHLYSHSAESAITVPVTAPLYAADAPQVYGFELLNACFDAAFAHEPRLVAFGEDVGRLGDVNQGMRGLQEKYGSLRISDTGIREVTIIGQAIGLAMRGLRPLAEIQYLDYLPYALQIMSDDLATLHWRTKGGQKAPVIVRTRGHRLEGVWHSGSPMGAVIHLLRGIYVLVPRNMTQAAGFYNTLLLSDEPALVVEVLNAYRIREALPDNIGQFTVPLGVPEVLRTGVDITLVTYGACCRVVLQAAERLAQVSIQAEVIDVQSLLPFDLPQTILASLKKTSRVVFIDEDVPGGASAYMLQQVLETQGGYAWLDSAPRTITAAAHRPAYGSDGDYWSKPSPERVFETVYRVMHDLDPKKYPLFWE